MTRPDTRRRRAATRRLPQELSRAVEAARDKKAMDIVVLDLRQTAAFTDFFLICTGQNVRQTRTIAEAIEQALRAAGIKPALVEGVDRAEWVLLDYFDFIVHVFTPETRTFYALERLWGSGEPLAVPEDRPPAGAAGRS
jgi:ribosome-associated protein